MKKSKKKKIGIIGVGYVGGALASVIPKVLLYDKYKKIGSIEEVNKADIIFICVPTPWTKKIGFDPSAIEDAFSIIKGRKIIVIKSTVIPGTTEKMQKKYPHHKVLFNPEFLRQATAKEDMRDPFEQIIGYTKKSKPVAKEILKILPKASAKFIVSAKEAEMAKYFSNVFLSTKVVFANQIYDLCQKLGINYDLVKEMARVNPRFAFSHFEIFQDGYRGYSGACLEGDEYVFSVTDNGIKPQPIKDFNESNLLSYDNSSDQIFIDTVLAKAERIVPNIVKVYCTKGKTLKMSLGHLAIVKTEDGNFKIKKAEDLVEGEFLPVAIGGISRQENSLYQNISFYRGTEEYALVQKLNQSYSDELKPYLTFHQYKDFRRTRHHAIPLSACISAGIPIENLRIKSGRGATVIPADIVLNEDFARFIGYYLAEGHTGDGRVFLSFGYHEDDLIEDVRNILKSFDIKWSERVSNWKGKPSSLTFKISSKILSSWFSQWGKNCYLKEIPPFLFFASQSIKDALLSGLFRGDGHIERSDMGEYCTVVYATVSRKLHEGVDLLLREKGIVASKRNQMGRKATVPAFWLRISEIENTKKLLPLFTERQIKNIKHGGRSIKSPAYELFPERNLSFIKIKKIERISKPCKVFALETKSGHYLTSGGIITHNCLPKDTKSLIQLGDRVGVDLKLLKLVERINNELLKKTKKNLN